MLMRQFWTLAAERAVKTFAQALAAVLVASGVGILSADWKTALSTAGMATLVSVLTSVASSGIGPSNSPSLVSANPPGGGAAVVPIKPDQDDETEQRAA
jgi:Putative lactococcus lactis phage r1t holin